MSARDLFAQSYVDAEFPGYLPDEYYTLSAVRAQMRIACKAGWDAGRKELQARIKDLDEAACELLTGWDSLVAANAELQRRIDAALALLKGFEPKAVVVYDAEVCDLVSDVKLALTTEEQKR